MTESDKHLHVVSFDIPWPASYGGVIDVYYKLLALHRAGVKLHLHCYEYGRQRANELGRICETVTYYKRTVFKNPFYGSLPYIVSSRNTSELLQNLLLNTYPILFEGLHTCYYLTHPTLRNRMKIVRAHNVEHHYYSGLEKIESNYFKKYFFNREADRLRRFQQRLSHASYVAAISATDTAYFQQRFPNTIHLPPFHQHQQVLAMPGTGKFALYHGNLAVGENDEAAAFLVKEVWNETMPLQLVVAGNNPSKTLRRLCNTTPGVTLMAGTGVEEINKLIQTAQINLLPTFQPTGVKLKLINALYLGRHCIANMPMVKNTGAESLCHPAETASDWLNQIARLAGEPWTTPMSQHREQLLIKLFNTDMSAKALINLLG